eukprot:scaffold460069_cov45-Prasinocladus_malaysianus.AAC.1
MSVSWLRSFAGQVMWPTAPIPETPPCEACGQPRVFEMQLMAPLVYYLDEAADWAESSGTDSGLIRRPPSSWAWATIAVYVCSKNCPGEVVGADGTHCMSEEWVTMADE